MVTISEWETVWKGCFRNIWRGITNSYPGWKLIGGGALIFWLRTFSFAYFRWAAWKRRQQGCSEAQPHTGTAGHRVHIANFAYFCCHLPHRLLEKVCWDVFKVEIFNLLVHREGKTSLTDGQMLASQKKRSKLMESFLVCFAPFHKAPQSLSQNSCYTLQHTLALK